jgi:uncharacterized protein
MADYFADSSMLVKRHVQETGTSWFRALAEPSAGHTIIIARISVVEVFSALNRRLREGMLSREAYTTIAADFAALCSAEYQVIELTAEVTNLARALLERRALRAYDAVQLASALLVRNALRNLSGAALTFLCADERLTQAAAAEGLLVDNAWQTS